MRQAKKSVTLDGDLVAEIEELVGAGGFSAFVNEGARMRLMVERGRAAVREYEAERGVVPADALARVDAQWPD